MVSGDFLRLATANVAYLTINAPTCQQGAPTLVATQYFVLRTTQRLSLHSWSLAAAFGSASEGDCISRHCSCINSTLHPHL